MTNIRRRLAEEVGIQPAYVKGMEDRGLCYFTWPESYAVGGQCECCNSILWVDPRENQILSEPRPSGIPAYGDGYRAYYENKLERFLKSLPACPSCGKNIYDKFINNVSFPRFSDGTEFDDKGGNVELINEDPRNVEIWWAHN